MSAMDIHGNITMHPGWIICGVDNRDPEYPCRLIASDKLTLAEITYKAEFMDAWLGQVAAYPVMKAQTLTLTAYLNDMIIIDGKTWQLCFEELFRTRGWHPGMQAIEGP